MCRSAFLLVALVLALLPSSVLAEPSATTSTALSTHITKPDFSNPRLLMNLIILCTWLPFSIVIVFFIYRRRNRFPIAGRGGAYLMATGIKHLFAVSVLSAFSLMYPVGVPCGIHFVLYFAFAVPAVVVYLLRGFTLVFRLEIMNFLAESRWRDEKRTMLREHQEKVAEHEPAAPSDGQTKLVVSPPSDEPDDPSTIPGYFFIVHRRWIEPAWMFKWVTGIVIMIIIAMFIIGSFDPDVDLTDTSFRDRGLLAQNATTGEQFTGETFGTAPVCLVYSIKYLLFQFLLSTTLTPGVQWCIWRIQIDSKRAAARKKEQEEVYRLIHGEDMPPLSAASGTAFDDLRRVKIELFLVFILTLTCSAAFYVVQYYEPGYGLNMLLFTNMATFTTSVVRPVQLSFSAEWKLRSQFVRSRSHKGDSDAPEKGGANRKSDSDRLPHHRPYYNLKFIMRHPHTFDALLAFLRKEFSSENALFYREARDFERDAKSLESRVPGWPSTNDETDTGQTKTGNSSHQQILSDNGRSPMQTSTNNNNTAPGSGATALRTLTVRVASTNSTVVKNDTATPDASSGGQTQTATPFDGTGDHFRIRAPSPAFPPTTVSPLIHHSLLAPTPQGTPPPSESGQRSIEFSPPAPSPSAIQKVPSSPVDFAALHAEAHRLKSWAQKMADEYLHRSAMYEINISEDLSKLVASQMVQLEHWEPTPMVGDVPDQSGYPVPPPFPLSTLFRQTQLSVFELIQRDSFRRFILTPGFHRLLQHADEEELARLEREGNILHGAKNALDQALLSGTAVAIIGGIERRPTIAGAALTPKQSSVSGSNTTPKGGSRLLLEDDAQPSPVPRIDDDMRLPGQSTSGEWRSPNGTLRTLPSNERRVPRRPAVATHYSRVDEEESSPDFPTLGQGRSLTNSPQRVPRMQAYRLASNARVREDDDTPETIVAFSRDPS